MKATERNSGWRSWAAGALVAVAALWAPVVHAATATINPSQDNTVAEDFPNNSSGACDSIFAGNTDNGFARRALMRFDVGAQIPPGSTINSVTLTLTITRGGNNADSTMTLHPLNAAWVEGVEDCGVRGGGQGAPSTGGVTWNTMPGFGASSGGAAIVDADPAVWSGTVVTDPMVIDVQGWLDNPGNNNGWMVIGDENNPNTTRRFGSREGSTPPQLVVDFTPTGDTEACCDPVTGGCALTIVGSGDCPGDPQGIGTTCEPNLCPQPQGACCNADNSCDDNVDKNVCEGAGGTFVGGNCNQADCGLTPFVEPLPIPPVLQPTGTRPDGVLQYTVSVEQVKQSVHPGLPDTDVWTYNGAWPGATIVATKGQPIEVTYQNNLPTGGGNRGSNLLEVDTCAHGPNYWGNAKRIVTHLHGGHVPAKYDGEPEYTILPGESTLYEYPNNQDAATLWYHDHALGITRLNVYGGMAGFYLIGEEKDQEGLEKRDTLGPDNDFGFPSGTQHEIGLAIQDRTFNADGSLFYNAQLEDAFKGEYAVVNGKVSPYLNVDQGKYRFRILNGSQSREYILELKNLSGTTSTTTGLVDPHFLLVGTDEGLVSAPIDLTNKFGRFAPAERMDVVIDFEGYPVGTEILLGNAETTPPLLPSIMKFIVTSNSGYTGAIASTLRTVPTMAEGSEDAIRYFRLMKNQAVACKDGSGRTTNEWTVQSLDGPGGIVTGEEWDHLTDFPRLGSREVWEFENPTNVMHPMHVHLVRFQILSKTDLDTGQPISRKPWEVNTWKDTVRVPPRSKVRIIMDFEDYPGRFPQHCHILDHEDHEMMRQYQTTHDPANCVVNGVCDPGEDCQSCPSDCAQVSGASCGNGLCEAGDGESCITCPADCAGKQKGKTQYCCGAAGTGETTGTSIGCGVDASDTRCIDASAGLACRMEARLPACCGDALCEGQETETSCAADCAPPPPTCNPDETPEQSCFDGNDNDCDSLTDCADTADCDGSTGPATTCGVGVCGSTGNLTCSGGTQVDTCTPGTPGVEGPNGDATCSDGLDNDCDGLTDASDPDCQGAVDCSQYGDKTSCNNDPNCRWKQNQCQLR